jgi:hypothetical protein
MSIPEELVQESAKALSRRSFLKGLGAMVSALGLKLAGGQPVKAAGCCPGPECGGCNGGGNYCPTGYTTEHTWKCCVDFWQWQCKRCSRWFGNDKYTCYCSHDDYVPGMCCPNPPCPGLQAP